jgi:hypothetical protein
MVSSVLFFEGRQTRPRPNANFGTTKAPGNLMTLMPLFGSGSRSRRDHSGDDAKKKAAVSGGF